MAQGKFSQNDVVAMRIMRLAGLSYGKIANAFGASTGTIKPAIDGQTHKGVLFPDEQDVDKVHQDKDEALALAHDLLTDADAPHDPVDEPPVSETVAVEVQPEAAPEAAPEAGNDQYIPWDATPYAKQRVHGLRLMQISGPQVRFIRRTRMAAKDVAALVPTFQGTHLTPGIIQQVRSNQMCKWVSDEGRVWTSGESPKAWED